MSRDDETYVVLKPSKGVACFECHESTKFVYPHLPYATGMCTRSTIRTSREILGCCERR